MGVRWWSIAPTIRRLVAAIAGVLVARQASAQEFPDWLGTPGPELQRTFLSVQVWQWIGLGVALLVSLVAGNLVFRLLVRLFDFAKRHEQYRISRGVKRSASFLAATLVFQGVTQSLWLQASVQQSLDVALLLARYMASAFLLAGLYDAACERLADRAGARALKAKALLIPFAQKFGRFTIFCIAIVAALGSLNQNVGAIVAGLGIGGVAIALAAKDSIENLFGALTLVMDLPFGIGDWVKIGPVEGVVEEINLRSTRIRTIEDSMITLPNSNLIRASVDNLGMRRYRRFQTSLFVRNWVSPDGLRSFCGAVHDAVASQPSLVSGETRVFVREIGFDRIEIQVICQLEVSDAHLELETRHKLLLSILDLSERHNVQLGPTPVASPAV